jgi:hypothetical protein
MLLWCPACRDPISIYEGITGICLSNRIRLPIWAEWWEKNNGPLSIFTPHEKLSDPYLTRIIHEASTAAVDPGMSAALRSVGFLDVWSSTPAESFRIDPRKINVMLCAWVC